MGKGNKSRDLERAAGKGVGDKRRVAHPGGEGNSRGGYMMPSIHPGVGGKGITPARKNAAFVKVAGD